MFQAIYLDHAATTPTDPRVVEAMQPYFSEFYGNPSSPHRFGRKAERAIELARDTIAEILHCPRGAIVFTGCGTESDNLALRGPVVAAKMTGKRARVITAKTEHHAVSATAAQIGATMDTDVTFLPVTREGIVTPDALRSALQVGPVDAVTIVSVMYGNNEVGTIQPIRELAAVAHQYGALFHTDAVQAGGQLPMDVQALGVDMLSLSAHKFYGPKGVGLLYVREGVPLLSAQTGGGQENDRRSGTHNVPLIVGLARALELAYTSLAARAADYARHRDRLILEIPRLIPGTHLTGSAERLPNHASCVFEGVNGNTLLMHLDMAGIAASSGSACNTGNPEPSEVLLTMGYPSALALGSLRLTVGRQTTDAEIDRVLEVLPDAVAKLRSVKVTPVES
ncbi:MAG TPA: cysteine desulfurase family protein [Aggregatilineales bacterium]|nr:cysteine desulfurase family protein [Aggregatilineales bacterium]